MRRTVKSNELTLTTFLELQEKSVITVSDVVYCSWFRRWRTKKHTFLRDYYERVVDVKISSHPPYTYVMERIPTSFFRRLVEWF